MGEFTLWGTTITGTTNNQVLNLGLVKGSDGNTPNITIGNVIALPYGTYPYANITGTTLNPLLNLGLEQGPPGITPNFTIGNVSTLLSGLATATITGTTNYPILNLGLVKGI